MKGGQRERATYRSRPEINPVLDLPVFEPGTAFLLPNGRLVELVEMGVDIIECFLLDVEGFDGLRLDLAHHLDGVFDARFNGGEEGSARPCGARSLQINKSAPKQRHVKKKIQSKL